MLAWLADQLPQIQDLHCASIFLTVGCMSVQLVILRASRLNQASFPIGSLTLGQRTHHKSQDLDWLKEKV